MTMVNQKTTPNIVLFSCWENCVDDGQNLFYWIYVWLRRNSEYAPSCTLHTIPYIPVRTIYLTESVRAHLEVGKPVSSCVYFELTTSKMEPVFETDAMSNMQH